MDELDLNPEFLRSLILQAARGDGAGGARLARFRLEPDRRRGPGHAAGQTPTT